MPSGFNEKGGKGVVKTQRKQAGGVACGKGGRGGLGCLLLRSWCCPWCSLG